MDEINMDGIELPDLGDDYEGGDVIEVGESSENRKNMALPSDSDIFELEDAAMPVLSEMDGESVSASKISDEDKMDPASFNKPVAHGHGTAMPVLSEMDGESVSASKISDEDKSDPASFNKAVGGSRSNPAFEEMGGGARPVVSNRQSGDGQQSGGSQGGQQNRRPTYDEQFGSGYRNSYSAEQNAQRENALDMAMRMKQENYEKGKGKAKILGGIVLGAAALRLISSLASGWSITTMLNIVLAGLIGYYGYRFINGSDKARRVLGWLTLFDAGDCIYGIISYFALKRQIENLARLSAKLGEAFGTGTDGEDVAAIIESSITFAMKFALFTSVVGLIVFAVMTYFFLLDSSVSDFTIDD